MVQLAGSGPVGGDWAGRDARQNGREPGGCTSRRNEIAACRLHSMFRVFHRRGRGDLRLHSRRDSEYGRRGKGHGETSHSLQSKDWSVLVLCSDAVRAVLRRNIAVFCEPSRAGIVQLRRRFCST